MLTMPSYIERLGLRGTKPQFKARPIDITQLFDAEVPMVETRTRKTTERVKLAFGAAAAEWVVWRLDGITDVIDILQFIEAIWAAIIDYRYAREIPHKKPADEDPLRYILFVTWRDVNALFLRCQEGDGNPDDCVQLSLLARHVLPKKHHGALKDWLTVILQERVKTLWPMDPDIEDPVIRQGSPVPREVFNPDFDFDPGRSTDLLQAFLEGLDYTANPYLRSPEEMKQLGFPGTPYKV
jgi:hypothetical protein